MLQNAYFLAKIGADTAENEQHFAEILPKIGNYPTYLTPSSRNTRRPALEVRAGDASGSATRPQPSGTGPADGAFRTPRQPFRAPPAARSGERGGDGFPRYGVVR